MTARTAPPAITPVPSGAGFRSTIPDPKRPSTMCGMLVWVSLIRIRFFFADSIPLRMACGTSFAFPEPYPTTAELGSPTTTRAAKERFLPPLTTLVTRLIATTWSLSWYEPASSFLIIVGIASRFLFSSLELQSGFTRGIGQGLDPSVINVTAAIEHNFGNSLSLGTFGDGFAHGLGCGDVSASAPLALLSTLGRMSRDQGFALEVVDQLYVNVIQRAIDVQPRTLGGAEDLLADAFVNVTP